MWQSCNGHDTMPRGRGCRSTYRKNRCWPVCIYIISIYLMVSDCNIYIYVVAEKKTYHCMYISAYQCASFVASTNHLILKQTIWRCILLVTLGSKQTYCWKLPWPFTTGKSPKRESRRTSRLRGRWSAACLSAAASQRMWVHQFPPPFVGP